MPLTWLKKPNPQQAFYKETKNTDISFLKKPMMENILSLLNRWWKDEKTSNSEVRLSDACR